MKSKNARSRRLRFLQVLPLIVFLLWGCRRAGYDEAKQAAPASARPVTVAKAVRKSIPLQITTFGKVKTVTSVSIRSLVAGQILAQNAIEGQEVKKGDLLLTIDPRPSQNELERAQADLAKDEAQLKYALAEVARYTDVMAKGYATKEQVDQFRSQAGVFEAAIRADKADIEIAKLNLEYCYIRAPQDGQLGEVLVDVGNIVKVNDVPIVVLNLLSPIEVSFSVPEQEFPRLKRYMAEGKLPVAAVIPGDEEHPQEGVVTFLDNQVDSTTGTVKLKALFENKDRRLWPGQYVRVAVTLTQLPDVVTVPSTAPQPGQEGTYVFVVAPDMTVQMRMVETGATYGDDTVIVKGVTEGETVVTDGQLLLEPGSRVEIKKAPVGAAP